MVLKELSKVKKQVIKIRVIPLAVLLEEILT